MTEKEAILVRHSVRNYKNQKIDADTGQHHRMGVNQKQTISTSNVVV